MMAKTGVSFKLTFLVREEGRGRGGGGGEGELFIVKGPVMPGGWEMSIWILLFCVKHCFQMPLQGTSLKAYLDQVSCILLKHDVVSSSIFQ